MRIDHIAGMAVEHLFGRLLRRALAALAIAIFALIALYQGSVAATLALQAEFGAIYAHLILFGVYLALAIIAFIVFWAMGRNSGDSTAPALSGQPREMQIAMLVEAVVLGYALAKKGDRA